MSNVSCHSRKNFKKVMLLKWVGPYLTIPVLFVASLVIDSWLQESGVTPYVAVGRRSVFSIWRVVMLACLVGTPLGTIFLSEAWKNRKNDGVSFTGFFFSNVFCVFALTASAAVIGSFAILAPMGISSSLIAQLVFTRCLFAVVWSVSAAALCSSITSGPGGAILSLGLFSLALFPGLTGSSMSWWFIAPLGDMVTTANSLTTGWNSTLAVTAHSLVYMSAAAFLLKKNYSLSTA